jgi:hypothetical protein
MPHTGITHLLAFQPRKPRKIFGFFWMCVNSLPENDLRIARWDATVLVERTVVTPTNRDGRPKRKSVWIIPTNGILRKHHPASRWFTSSRINDFWHAPPASYHRRLEPLAGFWPCVWDRVPGDRYRGTPGYPLEPLRGGRAGSGRFEARRRGFNQSLWGGRWFRTTYVATNLQVCRSRRR